MIYGTKRVNGSKGHIRIAQGLTTKVYRFYPGAACTKVTVTHAEVKPIIFRNTYWNGKAIWHRGQLNYTYTYIDSAHSNPEDSYREDFGG